MFLFFLATFECNFCHLPEISEHKQSQQSSVPKSLFWDSPRATLRVVKFSCSLGTGNDRIMLWLYYCNPQKIEKKERERREDPQNFSPSSHKIHFLSPKNLIQFCSEDHRLPWCLVCILGKFVCGWCWVVWNINDPLWHYL